MTTKRVSDEKIKNAVVYLLAHYLNPVNGEATKMELYEFLDDFFTLPSLLLTALLIELEADKIIKLSKDDVEVPTEDGKTTKRKVHIIELGEEFEAHHRPFNLDDFPAQVKEAKDYLEVAINKDIEEERFMDEYTFEGYTNGFHKFALIIAKQQLGLIEITIETEAKDDIQGGEYKFYTLPEHADKDWYKKAFRDPELCKVVEKTNC